MMAAAFAAKASPPRMKPRSPGVKRPPRPADVKSASRTLDLLESFAKASQPLSHAELALRTAIPKSSLTELLRTLQARDYVEALGDGGPFRLGPAAQHLIAYGLDVQRLVACIEPAMQALAEQSTHSCGLNLLKADVVERVHGITAPSGLAMHEGVRAPLYASSAGKLFLARMDDAQLEQYFERVELRPLARRSIRSLGELHRQIHSARTEGVAYSRDEFTNGVVGLSAPVLDADGRMIAALGVAVPTAVFDQARAAVTRMLEAAAGSASAAVRRNSRL
jgi:DNA-binding IclR family transcriptional regulator